MVSILFRLKSIEEKYQRVVQIKRIEIKQDSSDHTFRT